MNLDKFLNKKDDSDSNIVMFDDENNEIVYNVFSVKEQDNVYYMLAETTPADSDEPESEVYIFKCIAENELSDEMIFEMVDEEHEAFELAFSLFEGDFDKLGIEY